MIYGPDGNPAKIDPRTVEQIEFDRKLKAQMQDNGGQFFPKALINRIKDGIITREVVKAKELAQARPNTAKMDMISGEYDSKSSFRRRKPHSV